MRRIAYFINEADPSCSVVAKTQMWPLDYAAVLEEVGGILQVAAGYLRAPVPPSGTDLHARPSLDSLGTRIEHAQQQLRTWETQLAQDVQVGARTAELAASSPAGAAESIAIRGSLLTDLRRMLDEAHDIVEVMAHARLA